jgi:hypothetical protein
MKYEHLEKEAKALFDYVVEFWLSVEEGEDYSAIDYADAEYAEDMFRKITNHSIEEINLKGK